MASFTERLGGALAGMPIDKEAELTPQQRSQVSQSYLNIAQALLTGAATNQGTGQAFANALGKAQAGYQASLKAQQTAELNNLRLEQARRANEAQKRLSSAQQSAPTFSDFGGNYNEWSMATAKHYFDAGLPSEAQKYLAAVKPRSPNETAELVFKQREKHRKPIQGFQEAKANFEQVKQLVSQGNGTAAYAAVVTTLKGLDGSVVKEGEVRTLELYQGALKGLEAKIEKFKGGGLPPDLAAELLNLAGIAIETQRDKFNAYATEENKLYATYLDQALADSIIKPVNLGDMQFQFTGTDITSLINNNYDEFN